ALLMAEYLAQALSELKHLETQLNASLLTDGAFRKAMLNAIGLLAEDGLVGAVAVKRRGASEEIAAYGAGLPQKEPLQSFQNPPGDLGAVDVTIRVWTDQAPTQPD